MRGTDSSDAQLKHLNPYLVMGTVGVFMVCSFGIRTMVSDAPIDTQLSYELLQQQNAALSAEIIQYLRHRQEFATLAKSVADGIVARDMQDGDKLQEGIQFAIDKKVIPATIEVEHIFKIDVVGKTPKDVVEEIMTRLGPAATKGCIMTLQGLSGTGKGTTVALLKNSLPGAVTWSNGNMFRALTLLSVTYAEQQGVPLESVLTPELLDSFVKMLSFGKYGPAGSFDTRIRGLGFDTTVSQIQNTQLKSKAVSKNIPTVAAYTQGEVINFVQDCLDQLSAEGKTVLLEGREQTLNYIRTPNRFELCLSDSTLIGERRLAQKVGAVALQSLGDKLRTRPQKTGVPKHQVERYVLEAFYQIEVENSK